MSWVVEFGAAQDQGALKRVHARSRNSTTRFRLIGALLPAAAITAGLFVIMNELIRVDEIQVDTSPQRPLTPLTPKPHEPAAPKAPSKVDIPTTLELPALPPPSRPAPGDLVPTGPTWKVPEPEAPRADKIDMPLPPSGAFMDRAPTPVRPPVPSYPEKAIRLGLQGTCDVHLNVTAQGLPYDVRAVCTNPAFVSEAERSVSRTEFLPKVVNGQAVEHRNAVYPLTFELVD